MKRVLHLAAYLTVAAATLIARGAQSAPSVTI